MQYIYILIGMISLVSAVNAETIKLVYDGVTLDSIENCKALNLTPEDLAQIVFWIDNTKMRGPSDGFPLVIRTEKLEGDFRITSYLGLARRCGGYVSAVSATLNGRLLHVKLLGFSTPYVEKTCTTAFIASIHLEDASNARSPNYPCVVKLKSVNY